MQVARRIEVDPRPQEILIPDGKVAYVSCAGGKVAAIDLEKWNVQKLIGAGTYPDGLARRSKTRIPNIDQRQRNRCRHTESLGSRHRAEAEYASSPSE